jgi:hypothetical protein
VSTRSAPSSSRPVWRLGRFVVSRGVGRGRGCGANPGAMRIRDASRRIGSAAALVIAAQTLSQSQTRGEGSWSDPFTDGSAIRAGFGLVGRYFEAVAAAWQLSGARLDASGTSVESALAPHAVRLTAAAVAWGCRPRPTPPAAHPRPHKNPCTGAGYRYPSPLVAPFCRARSTGLPPREGVASRGSGRPG